MPVSTVSTLCGGVPASLRLKCRQGRGRRVGGSTGAGVDCLHSLGSAGNIRSGDSVGAVIGAVSAVAGYGTSVGNYSAMAVPEMAVLSAPLPYVVVVSH